MVERPSLVVDGAGVDGAGREGGSALLGSGLGVVGSPSPPPTPPPTCTNHWGGQGGRKRMYEQIGLTNEGPR
jgi:hypothetical protein